MKSPWSPFLGLWAGVFLLAHSGAAQTTVLFEGFEGVFPGANWSVGHSNTNGSPAYWDGVNSAFGGEGTRSGSWKGYCAGVGYVGTSDSPSHTNYMAASMSRSIDLTVHTNAALSFWYKIPSIDATWDFCNVYVDTNRLWHHSATATNWTPQILNLTPCAGANHTLTFEFTSDYICAYEGWYPDAITVSANTTVPPSPLTATAAPARPTRPTTWARLIGTRCAPRSPAPAART